MITSVIVMADVSYAQISEQISSPKKQIDTGIVPHYVICKNDLLLVERPNGKIACVTEQSAKTMNWNIVDQLQNILNNKNVIKNPTDNKSLKTKTIFDPHIPILTNTIISNNNAPTSLAIYDPGPNSIKFPNIVPVNGMLILQVNETLTVEYMWNSSKINFGHRYLPDNQDVVIMLSPNVEFVDIGNHTMSNKCSNSIFTKFNPLTNETHVETFSIKHTVPPGLSAHSSASFTIFFADGGKQNIAGLSGTYWGENSSMIHLSNTIDSANKYDQNYIYTRNSFPLLKCQYITQSHNDLPIQPFEPNATMKTSEIPECILEYQWNWLTDTEKKSIISNSTTCKIEDDVMTTNLPYNWHRMPAPQFKEYAEYIDELKNASLIGQSANIEEFLHNQGIYEKWVGDFVSYYDTLSISRVPDRT